MTSPGWTKLGKGVYGTNWTYVFYMCAYIYMCIYMYIYIYIHMYTYNANGHVVLCYSIRFHCVLCVPNSIVSC